MAGYYISGADSTFDHADAGKPVHFIGRWQSTRGDKGPISETISATVPG